MQLKTRASLMYSWEPRFVGTCLISPPAPQRVFRASLLLMPVENQIPASSPMIFARALIRLLSAVVFISSVYHRFMAAARQSIDMALVISPAYFLR
eukprot:1004962-Pleurochrysis_carterae.AAC.3